MGLKLFKPAFNLIIKKKNSKHANKTSKHANKRNPDMDKITEA